MCIVEAPTPPSFAESTSSFSWASLQFPGLLAGSFDGNATEADGDATNSSAVEAMGDGGGGEGGPARRSLQEDAKSSVAAKASGAQRYLSNLQASAEQLLLSSIIVQVAIASFVIGTHLAINAWVKKKKGFVPSALAFPKCVHQRLSIPPGPCVTYSALLHPWLPPIIAGPRPPPPQVRGSAAAALLRVHRPDVLGDDRRR